MFNFDLNSLNIDETSLKAFIHQKVNEIQQYSKGEPVSIKMKLQEDQSFKVKIVTNHSVGEIHAEAESTDIFESIAQAKDLVLQCINELSTKGQLEESEAPETPEFTKKTSVH